MMIYSGWMWSNNKKKTIKGAEIIEIWTKSSPRLCQKTPLRLQGSCLSNISDVFDWQIIIYDALSNAYQKKTVCLFIKSVHISNIGWWLNCTATHNLGSNVWENISLEASSHTPQKCWVSDASQKSLESTVDNEVNSIAMYVGGHSGYLGGHWQWCQGLWDLKVEVETSCIEESGNVSTEHPRPLETMLINTGFWALQKDLEISYSIPTFEAALQDLILVSSPED